MDSTSSSIPPRPLTLQEVATVVRRVRDLLHWSQETLAEISRLDVRTIQRVEGAKSASFDTRRSLALAFGLDADALTKPQEFPDDATLRAAKEKFDREHVILALTPLTSGRQLAKLAEGCGLSQAEPGFEMSREAAAAFAALTDYFREYGDCHDLYTEVQKLDIFDEIQGYIDQLKALDVSLFCVERTVHMRFGLGDTGAKPLPVSALYVFAFPLGKEPKHVAIPKAGKIG